MSLTDDFTYLLNNFQITFYKSSVFFGGEVFKICRHLKIRKVVNKSKMLKFIELKAPASVTGKSK